MMFRGEFRCLTRECKVFCFEPDLVSDLIGVRWCCSCCLVQGFFGLLPFLRRLSRPIINELDGGWRIREFHHDLGGIP